MTSTKKILVALLAVLCLCSVVFASGSKEPIKIIYTNDVHCSYETGYSDIAAVKKMYEAVLGKDRVTLVDCGDAIQGKAIGTVSDGKYIIDIMNKVGYDFAIFGNHEFDYGVETLAKRVSEANAKYLNCNFNFIGKDKSDNKAPKTIPYSIVDYDGTSVAFIGVSTAETITKSTPTYFMNGNREWIYSFLDWADLFAEVQKCVNKARKNGADYVVVLSHLGVVRETESAIAPDLIANTYGIDVVLDGHSHSTVESATYRNLVGKDVLYSQTGIDFENIGVLTIVPGETVYTEFVKPAKTDAETAAFIEAITDELDETLLSVVAHSSVFLSDKNADGARAVRNRETALGNLCADAYRLVSGADIGFANGGGIRAAIKEGDITLKDIISVFPYNNSLCMCEATGQEILDALEWGSKATSSTASVGVNAVGENGGFLQVSGLKYTIDTSIASTCIETSDKMFGGVSGARRVKDVYVGSDEKGWEPIDPAKTYTLACHNYKLKSMGDGFNMFYDNNYILDSYMIDNQMLINYIKDFLGGNIGDQYAKTEGRITVL